MNKKVLLVSAVAVLAAMQAGAQTKIGDNPATINSNAILELESANKGLLLPRLALTSTATAAPLTAHVAGMVVYNTATAGDVTPGYYYDNGTNWIRLADNAGLRANNGLTRVSDSIQLGGALTRATAINATGANNLVVNANGVGSGNNDQNQGFTVIATAADNNNRAIGTRSNLLVPANTTVVEARGSSNTANVVGTVSGTATGSYNNAVLRPGSNVASGSTVTGASGDVEVLAGTGNLDNTRTLTGARFGSDAANGTAARTTGVTATAVNSASSNIGVAASANMTEATLKTAIATQPAGFSTGVYSNNNANNANATAGYFTGSNTANQSSVLKAIANPGNTLAAGTELFAAQSSVTGQDVATSATSSPSTFRAQVNQATTNGNNVRVQGSLNEASSGGKGLGNFSQPQATGTTGLADYTGATDADPNDYIVGVRGAAYTSGNKTNGLNVVGVNFGGSFNSSVGGYFFPGNGTSNLGTVSQINGAQNAGWKDATFAGKNVAVVAMDAGVAAPKAITAANLAVYSNGNVQLSNLPATGNTALVGIDASGNLSTTMGVPASAVANGLQISTTAPNNGKIVLGGPLTEPTSITSAVNANNLRIEAAVATNNNPGLSVNASAGTAANVKPITLRTALDVPTGQTVSAARTVSANTTLSGAVSSGGTATAGFFQTYLRNGATIAGSSTVSGTHAEVFSEGGTTTLTNTNTLTGGDFTSDASSSAAARTTGISASATGSATSNVGVAAIANGTETDAKAVIAGQPAGFSSGVVGVNNASGQNATAGYFTGSNTANQSSVLKAIANPGNTLAAGTELFAAQSYVSGQDVSGTATGTPSTFRAQVNQATSNGNNVRVQGSLNEASSGGKGLGAFSQPQATGVTGLADYTGATDATPDDYIVGVRGAAYTAGTKTNGLNVVGVNFGGSFNSSVGGYFFPGNGTSNLGTVSQINGTANAGWKDATFAGKNVAVVAMDAGVAAPKAITAANLAVYANGNVQLSNLPATGNTALVGIDASGNLSTTAIPAAVTADNGLTKTGNNVQLGGALTMPTAISTDATNNLVINATGIGGSNVETNQGLNVLATSVNSGTAKAVALRGRVSQTTGAIGQARGVSGAANITGGNVAGTATGGYFNTYVAGATVATGGLVTGVAADAEAGANAGITTATNNTFAGARFGADVAGTPDAHSAGVVATAVGSTASNVGIAASATTNATALTTAVNALPAGSSAAIYSLNPLAATNNGAATNNNAIVSSGGVNLTNLGTTTATNLLGVDAAGNVSTTALPAVVTADNGLTKTGNNVQLGGTLTTDVVLDGATNKKGITVTGNGNTEMGIFKVQNNTTVPNPAGTSNYTQVVTSSLDGPTGSGSRYGDVVASKSDAYSSSDDNLIIGAENFGTTPLSTSVQGDFTHAIGTNGVAFANGTLSAAPKGMVIGVSGGISFNDGASNWNAIGTEGYLNFNQSTSGKAAAGHFDGNGATNSGTGFGVIGSIGDLDLYQTMFDPTLNGYKIGVAAVNHNPASANQLALYTEGNVKMMNLSGAGTNVVTMDASGNVGVAKAFAAITPTLTFNPALNNGYADQTVSVPGVVDGDAIYLGVPSTAVVPFGSYSAFVSTSSVNGVGGIVTIRYTNNANQTTNPSGSFKIKVMQ